MTIHTVSQIGNVLRNAVAFDFKRTSEAMMNADSLLAQAERLFSLLDERRIRCATVEGLLLLKLYALPSLYQQGSFERVGIYENDVATLMYAYAPDMRPILAELGKHLNETDMVEVRNILADVDERIKKFKQKK
jgi:hypothetical protein